MNAKRTKKIKKKNKIIGYCFHVVLVSILFQACTEWNEKGEQVASTSTTVIKYRNFKRI